MSAPEVRPTWLARLPEAMFRRLIAHPIVEVGHGWEFTSEDTSKHWIEVRLGKGTSATISSDMQSAFAELFEFHPDHRALFRLTTLGEAARKRLVEIDEFEKRNDRERREYERLKRKFEGGGS